MKPGPSRRYARQSGIALLIAIFVVLLVCVVGIAMMVASGTDTALTGNYHSATAVYYAALAGLEEGRGRIYSKNANYINIAVPGFFPAPGTPLPVGKVLYIENPVGGETVDPTPSGSAATYQDTEYDKEFISHPLAGATIYTTPSVSTVAGIPGPFYKWVRINAVTEESLKMDINGDSTTDPNTPVYYDGSRLNLTSTGSQALEVTAFAFSNGSQKILQYIVAPSVLSLSFPSALTMDGSRANHVAFTGATTNQFKLQGFDQFSNGACNPTAPPIPAVGVSNTDDDSNIATDINNVINGIPLANRPLYTGAGSAPSVSDVTSLLSPNFKTIKGLNALVQTITQNADVVVTGYPTPGYPTTVTQSDSQNIMPASMSASDPAVVVVNGDFKINAWHSTGYGLLLVTGTLTYDPDATWYGIILVIGQGYLYSYQGGTGQLNGAVFLARTVDSGGNPLPAYDAFGNPTPLGTPTFQFTSTAGSDGIRYSSCWIAASQPSISYQVLSFHEIPQ
jgi:hypothetical protein